MPLAEIAEVALKAVVETAKESNDSAYPSSPVFLVAKAALMVGWTWHQETPLTAGYS